MNRLFPTITPTHYALTLQPDLTNFTFLGNEIIKFRITKPTKELTFHAVQLTIAKAELIEQKYAEHVLRQVQDKKNEQNQNARMTPTDISYDEKLGRATCSFNKKIEPGEYALILSYTGLLGEKMKGWYRSEFLLNGEKHFLAATQFEEIGARQALVCIDEPLAKAVFDVTLIVPKNMTGVSNTIITEEVEMDDHKKLQFTPTPRMSTYLLAFIVGEFDSVSTTSKGGVHVRAFATPGKKQQLQFALDVAARCLDFYADYFATAYPLPVLDLIAIPDFDAGAMENWGAVTFREAALFVDAEKSSLANKQWVALVVAHELAHMWFGNLVTMEWWTHLWLNEGFACYIEYLATNALFPEWDMWKQFGVTEHASALSLDGLASSHPIEVPIENENQVKEIFDEISYAKGANVIQMLATFLGADMFRSGLRKYLADNAYGNTTTEQLWDAFEAVSKQPVRKIMQNWTQKVGYPLIHVSKKNGTYFLSQERFFASSIERENNTTKTLWQIPVSLAEEQRTEKLLLEEEVTRVDTESLWIKVNAGETSLVRCVYKDNEYLTLGSCIQKKELAALDRMGIIRDAFAAGEAGVIPTVDALRLLPYYQKEEEYIVWAAIGSGMGSLDNLIASMDKLREKYTAFGKSIFAGIAAKMGWEKRESDTHTDILLRSVVLFALGNYGDKATITHAKKLFANHCTGKKLIDPDIRGVVFALVAKNGGISEWHAFYNLYKKEESQQEKGRIMMALSSFENPELIAKTLTWSFADTSKEGQVRLQDKSRILMLLFMNPKAHQKTWEFIKTHWMAYKSMYQGLHGFTRVIEGAGNIVSLSLREEIAAFFAKHKEEDLERTVTQVLEKIDANIAWIKRDGEAIEKFLTNFV